jgi:hypothetical protein
MKIPVIQTRAEDTSVSSITAEAFLYDTESRLFECIMEAGPLPCYTRFIDDIQLIYNTQNQQR